MLDRYGLAVIRERTEPRRWNQVAAYLRQEYGPGTSPASLWALGGNGAPSERGLRKALGKLVARLVPRLTRAAPSSAPSREGRGLGCDGAGTATDP